MSRLAGLFVGLMLTAVRAELLKLKAVGVVAAILLGDVVAVLAHLAGQGDLGPHICTGSHVVLSFALVRLRSGGGTRSPDLTIMSRAL